MDPWQWLYYRNPVWPVLLQPTMTELKRQVQRGKENGKELDMGFFYSTMDLSVDYMYGGYYY